MIGVEAYLTNVNATCAATATRQVELRAKLCRRGASGAEPGYPYRLRTAPRPSLSVDTL
jgi:hypothetical protein